MKKIMLVVILIFGFVASAFGGPYEDWLSTCKDYKDVAKWMQKNFSYDMTKLRKVAGTTGQYPVPPEESFKQKTGVCYDASLLIKQSLNTINPEYKAELIFLDNRPYNTNHFVCGFYLRNELWVMDYGTPVPSMIGTFGPFKDLDDYHKNNYLRYHPKVKSGKVDLGWPQK